MIYYLYFFKNVDDYKNNIHYKMSEVAQDSFVDGSSFFGFMGVTMALILASTELFIKTLGQPMGQPKQEQALVVYLSGDLPLL